MLNLTANINFIFYFESINIDHIIYVTLNTLSTLFGAFSGLSIMIAILISKDLKTCTGGIIFNLAVADLLIASAGPFSLIGFFFFTFIFSETFRSLIFLFNTSKGVFDGRTFFDKYLTFCKLSALYCMVLCFVSIQTMILLSFNRYFNLILLLHKLKCFNRLINLLNFQMAVCLS